MDRRVALVSRRDRRGSWTDLRNLALLCPDCEQYHPGALGRAPIASGVRLDRLPLRPEVDRVAWLRSAMVTRGVYVPVTKSALYWRRRHRFVGRLREVWVPRMLRVTLMRLPGPRGLWEVRRVVMWPGQPLLPRRPQARTRGLPRPDRRRGGR